MLKPSLSHNLRSHSEPSHRLDIDGLRGFAVLGVVAFHLFPTFCPGGFTGVDVFFVISGYLISGQIFDKLERQKFSFKDFYARRIRRIIPSQALILLLSLCCGFLFLFPGEFQQLCKHVQSSVAFIFNYIVKFDIGYFAPNAYSKPLLHLWSLAVEEQFYFIFPLCVWAVYKFQKNLLIYCLILSWIGSFCLNIHFVNEKPDWIYFMLPSRAWELLTGSLLAFFNIRGAVFSFLKKRLQSIAYWVGVLFLCISYVYIKKSMPFPGWVCLFPVLGTTLVLAFPRNEGQFGLIARANTFIGKISYALYLWHWPLYSFFCIVFEKDIANSYMAFCIFVVSFILAYITTKFYEDYFRFYFQKTVILSISAFLLIGIVATAARIISLDPLPTLLKPEIKKIDFAMNDWRYGPPLMVNAKLDIPFESYGNGPQHILFVGDSNMQQYWPRVEKLMSDLKFQNLFTTIWATYGGQVPMRSCVLSKNSNACSFIHKLNHFIESHNLLKVVFSAQWLGYFYNENDMELIINELTYILKYLKNKGVRTYLILNMPVGDDFSVNEMIVRSFNPYAWAIKPMKKFQKKNKWFQESRSMNEKLKNLAKITGATIIDPARKLCPENQCLILNDQSDPIYKDGAHLGSSYVKEDANFIDVVFEDK